MSGIAGIFHRDGQPVNPNDLTQMIDRIAHRGPDGAAIWHEGSVGFGHRMLWTTPESFHEKLPFYRSDAKVTITADARIDNRNELMKSLNIIRHSNEVVTDSELILEAYLKWGERTPEKLLGDFAFSIWDGINQKLFCACDHFGIKPFYYYLSGSLFIFSSEIKAIIVNNIPRSLNELSIVDQLLVGQYVHYESTFYNNILLLPPAHSLTVSTDRLYKNRYWQLNPGKNTTKRSNTEYAEEFRHIFTEAVRSRMHSQFLIGSKMSGGLDSSSIACTANRHNHEHLSTFSAIFSKTIQSDESLFIKSVLEKDTFNSHIIDANEFSPFCDYQKTIFHEDSPKVSPSGYINWNLYNIARSHDVRVLLDGFDGDTTLSHGRGYLIELANKGNLLKLARETKTYMFRCNGPAWHNLFWYYLKTYNDHFLRLKAIRDSITHKPNVIKWPRSPVILNSDFARSIEITAGCAYQSQPAVKSDYEDHTQLINRPLMHRILCSLDTAAAAFNIELRYPFFDKRLVEYCLALPPEQKLFNGWNRIILRRAMQGVLPDKVQWRGCKSDLSYGFNHNLFQHSHHLLHLLIFEKINIISPYLNVDQLRKLYNVFMKNHGKSTNIGFILYKSAMLSQWLQQTKLS